MDFVTFLLIIGVVIVGFIVVTGKLEKLGLWRDGNQIWNDQKRRCWERNGRPGPLWSFDQRGQGRKSQKRQRAQARQRNSRVRYVR